MGLCDICLSAGTIRASGYKVRCRIGLAVDVCQTHKTWTQGKSPNAVLSVAAKAEGMGRALLRVEQNRR